MSLDVFADETNKISLSLTVVFLLYAIELLIRWWPAAAEAFFSKETTADVRLAKGIWSAHFFALCDNTYWLITWVTVLYKMDEAIILLGLGCMFNAVFRNGGGIYAVNEHMGAALMLHHGKKRKHKLYWIIGLLVYATLQVTHLGMP